MILRVEKGAIQSLCIFVLPSIVLFVYLYVIVFVAAPLL